MKNKLFLLMIFLCISFFTSCTPLVRHADPFYDYNDRDFPLDYLPLIKPVRATRLSPSSPWDLELLNVLSIELPKSQDQDVLHVYGFTRVAELEKFAVKDGVIIAYSPYVDQKADAYVQNNFYHWFVMVPSKNITKGFHTEEEFRQYNQTLGIQNPDWQTPDEAFDKFVDSGGCLEWIPDCK